MTRAKSELAVVHLVRKANGQEPLAAFLASYRQHAAGVPHELVLLFKGFSSSAEVEPYETLAGDLSARSVVVDDQGYDLGAYFAVAHQLSHERLCFLNSFSVLQVEDWLALLAGALDDSEIGLAGASGSWASVSSRVHWELCRRGAYAGIFDERQVFPERLLDTFAEFDPPIRRPGRMHRLLTLARILTGYPSFPAHHIRTNAFVIDRPTMLRLRAPGLHDKIDAHLLECGRRSITRQIEGMGLKVVVAGRDGKHHRASDWARSRTFWRGDQDNLLITDNQTENYRCAQPDVRLALSRWAWGAEAYSLAADCQTGSSGVRGRAQ